MDKQTNRLMQEADNVAKTIISKGMKKDRTAEDVAEATQAAEDFASADWKMEKLNNIGGEKGEAYRSLAALITEQIFAGDAERRAAKGSAQALKEAESRQESMREYVRCAHERGWTRPSDRKIGDGPTGVSADSSLRFKGGRRQP